MDTQRIPIRGTYTHPETNTPHSYEGHYWIENGKPVYLVHVHRPDGAAKMTENVGTLHFAAPAHPEGSSDPEADVRKSIEDAIHLRLGVDKEYGEE
jgi:hypothetical protein